MIAWTPSAALRAGMASGGIDAGAASQTTKQTPPDISLLQVKNGLDNGSTSVCRGIRGEFSDLRVAGVSLESRFSDALNYWRELETKKAKQILEYVAKYDPGFHAAALEECAPTNARRDTFRHRTGVGFHFPGTGVP